jgi:polyisoprenoid-binding protein YceI
MNRSTQTDTTRLEFEPVHARKRPRRWKIGLILATATVVTLGLGTAWWLGLFTPEPDPVSLEDAVADATGQTASEPASDDVATSDAGAEPVVTVEATQFADETTATSPTGAATTSPNATATSLIAGEWTVQENDATFVGYRADGQTGEAVGRSPVVEGSVIATDAQITSVAITADMTQLTSDSSLRDEHLGDEGIQYNTYPTSTFVLTEPIEIPADPTEGTELAFAAVGELTVREITLPVVVDLNAAILGGQLVVVGSTEISLDDYGASISGTDTATMEFSLVLAR